MIYSIHCVLYNNTEVTPINVVRKDITFCPLFGKAIVAQCSIQSVR